MISRNKQRKELIRMLYAMLDELEAKERHPNPGFPFNLLLIPFAGYSMGLNPGSAAWLVRSRNWSNHPWIGQGKGQSLNRIDRSEAGGNFSPAFFVFR